MNGVRLRMVKLNINNAVLSLFLARYKGIRYSLTTYGFFREFEL
jgi:hypothetical protein